MMCYTTDFISGPYAFAARSAKAATHSSRDLPLPPSGSSRCIALLPEKTREKQCLSSTCEGMSPSPLLLVNPTTSVFRPTQPLACCEGNKRAPETTSWMCFTDTDRSRLLSGRGPAVPGRGRSRAHLRAEAEGEYHRWRPLLSDALCMVKYAPSMMARSCSDRRRRRSASSSFSRYCSCSSIAASSSAAFSSAWRRRASKVPDHNSFCTASDVLESATGAASTSFAAPRPSEICPSGVAAASGTSETRGCCLWAGADVATTATAGSVSNDGELCGSDGRLPFSS
mmetsp:Transcript_3820/g.10998  ORF Transcript_3820/g.10998 Transcript_3820/m.10998 type:complete len:284 (-) Transcript_3820:342-1193(-)